MAAVRSFSQENKGPTGTLKTAKKREKMNKYLITTIDFGYLRDVNLRTSHLTNFQKVVVNSAARKNAQNRSTMGWV